MASHMAIRLRVALPREGSVAAVAVVAAVGASTMSRPPPSAEVRTEAGGAADRLERSIGSSSSSSLCPSCESS